MAITGETRIIDLPEKSSLVEGDFFVVDNENGATSKIPAAAVSGSATAGLVAEEYSNASTYAVGEYCIHVESGLPKLYKCTTAITTAEAWNSAHWTQTDAGSELTTANEDIASLNSNLSELKTINYTLDNSRFIGVFMSGSGVNVIIPTASKPYDIITANLAIWYNNAWLPLTTASVTARDNGIQIVGTTTTALTNGSSYLARCAVTAKLT